MASSDHEGSIGALRLNIDSTPLRSPASSDSPTAQDPDQTLQAAQETDESATTVATEPATDDGDDLPPAYEDDDAPPFGSTSQYNGPAGEQQLAVINDLKRLPLESGDTWNLVPRTWFRRWQTACSGVAESKEDDSDLTPEQVGPIDTTALTDRDGFSLRKPLQVGLDVEVVPAPAWGYLVEW